MEPRVIQVAQIWDLEHNPVNGRIYSPNGIAPTLMTPTGGYFEPKILLEMEEKEIIPYNTPEDGVAPTITTMYARLGTNNLTPGEYGGAMGIMEIKSCASRKRGDEHKIETRKDEVANCVTSIDTDSMVQEPLKIPQATKQGYIECPVGGVFDASYPDSDKRRGRVQENGEISPALTTNSEGAILRYEGVEPQVLAVERTEEAKDLRKKGIAHFKDKQHKPRTDGLSNCITSCLKDNLLQEPKKYIDNPLLQPSTEAPTYPVGMVSVKEGIQYKGKWMMEGDGVDTSRSETFGTHIMEGVSPTLRSERPDANAVCVKDGGTDYKGKFIKEGDGVLLNVTDSPNYIRGGLDGVSRTIKAEHSDAGTCVREGARYRIRKLTEREVFRLMDVSEEDIDKIQEAGISKTAMYKLAGNSIVVSCLYHLFRKLFCEPKCEEQQMSLFDFD